MKSKRTALITICVLTGVVVFGFLWLRSEQRQYVLNRKLIAALVKGDDKQALVLVNEGADPNTRYKPTLVPSLLELVKEAFHRSPSSSNDSPTALMMVCGAAWDDNDETFSSQERRPDASELVQTMWRHGANVNAQGRYKWTPLMWAVKGIRRKIVGVLLAHDANVNATDERADTALYIAVAVADLPVDKDGRPSMSTSGSYSSFRNSAADDIIHQLMTCRADPNLPTTRGITPSCSHNGTTASTSLPCSSTTEPRSSHAPQTYHLDHHDAADRTCRCSGWSHLAGGAAGTFESCPNRRRGSQRDYRGSQMPTTGSRSQR